MKIKIYTLPTCGYCKMTKEFLMNNNINFEEFNIDEDESAANEMIRISGQNGTPVIDVNGKIIIGFNEGELKKELNIK